ncbi:phosphate ABC transporter substrate-binding protein [Anaplasmataceae bacterium AB001_6]|nr:phosphate ABC transporter substrate-binding protein [Anaplasmataceae bacterium AB001_6]
MFVPRLNIICLYIAFLFFFNALSTVEIFARTYVRVVGSTTIFPIIARAAEEFAREYRTRTPLIESTGTGSGFKLFCLGQGEQFPDIVAASRSILTTEKMLCEVNNVGDIIELKIGNDAIILSSLRENTVPYDFNIKDLFYALSANVPVSDFNVQQNAFQKWSDINAMLPNKKIKIYGPVKNTGTYDSINKFLIYDNCINNRNFLLKYKNFEERKKVCSMGRADGVFVEVSNYDESVLLQKMKQDSDIISIVSYVFYSNNADKLVAHRINGVTVNDNTIRNGRYPLSRPLYLYIKKAHLDSVKDLRQFISSMFSKDAIGENGYMIASGLVPVQGEEKNKIDNILQNNQL